MFKVLSVTLLEWFSNFGRHSNELGVFLYGRFLASHLEIPLG